MRFIQGPRCVTCKKNAKELNVLKLNRCSSCKVVNYCSTTCQRKDFKSHQYVCGRINNAANYLDESKSELQSRNYFLKFKGKFIRGGNELTQEYYSNKLLLARLIWFLALRHESYEATEIVKNNLIEMTELEWEASALNIGPWLCFIHLFLGMYLSMVNCI